MTRLAFAAGMTIAAVRRRFADVLRTENFDTPDLDARVLVAYALGLDHAGLIRDSGRVLSSAEADAIAAFAARRLKREPVARIVGMKEFWSLPFTVNAATLVPRPETETVVEAALAAIDAGGGRKQALRVLDIGTGSGALLLALLTELPNAYGIGTDLSIDALVVARDNAVRLELAHRAAFVACDFAAALRAPFDLIVTNPPYVESEAIATLAPGVRDYEPRPALDGGPDGLDAYRAIADQVPRILAPNAHFVAEFGPGQSAAIETILRQQGLAVAGLSRDMSGILRALTAVYACQPGIWGP
jgi:release factor glutamine methyltransferase